MICVRFLRAYSVYNPGEVAAFVGAVAERLVDNQVAEMYVTKALGPLSPPQTAASVASGEPAKRKRGRPRKADPVVSPE